MWILRTLACFSRFLPRGNVSQELETKLSEKLEPVYHRYHEISLQNWNVCGRKKKRGIGDSECSVYVQAPDRRSPARNVWECCFERGYGPLLISFVLMWARVLLLYCKGRGTWGLRGRYAYVMLIPCASWKGLESQVWLVFCLLRLVDWLCCYLLMFFFTWFTWRLRARSYKATCS